MKAIISKGGGNISGSFPYGQAGPKLGAVVSRMANVKVWLLLVCCSLVYAGVAQADDATVFAGSFDGNVYSINVDNLSQPAAIAQPSSDCSFLAVRPNDGAAVCRSAPLDGAVGQGILSSFNVKTHVSIKVAKVHAITLLGPFYDPKTDQFFALGRQSGLSGLSFASISLSTLKLTWQNNVTFGKFHPVGFSGDAWSFSDEQRSVCGPHDNQYLTCISVDTLSATRQTKINSQTSAAWTSYFASIGVVQFSFTDLTKGCISSEGGIVDVAQIEPNGQGSKLVASLQSPNPPLCPFNTAAFVTDQFAYIFSVYKPQPGFWVVPFNSSSAATFQPVTNNEFAQNVESFIAYKGQIFNGAKN